MKCPNGHCALPTINPTPTGARQGPAGLATVAVCAVYQGEGLAMAWVMQAWLPAHPTYPSSLH